MRLSRCLLQNFRIRKPFQVEIRGKEIDVEFSLVGRP